MSPYLENKLGDFLYPYEQVINKAWFNLESSYPEIYNYGFIAYNTYAYRLSSKVNIAELSYQNSTLYFEEGLPQDVMDYIKNVDRYQEARLAIKSIFRKVINHFNENEAYAISGLISNLPNLDSKYPHLASIEYLRENNKEQLKAIKMINIDRLLLK